MEKVHRDFLLKRLEGVRHSGREFLEHLKGTHDILRDWGNPEHVCLAGLFHSVYGTQHFHHQSVDFKDRPVIRALIGQPAERLVYLFCVLDRPKVFLDSDTIITRNFYDHHSHQMVEIDRQTRNELIEIEAANLLEQGSLSIKIANRLFQTGISGAAKAHIMNIQWI